MQKLRTCKSPKISNILFHFFGGLNFAFYGVTSQPLSCWTRIHPAFANSVDPDQLASEEANWSGSALFAIKYVNL